MLKTFITIILLSSFSQSIIAQKKNELSKESLKKIKAELKSYLSNPSQYATEKETQKVRMISAEKELNDIKTGLRVERRDLDYARDSVNFLLAKIEELKNAAPAPTSSQEGGGDMAMSPVDCNEMPSKGTFYKVQIGNFSKLSPSGFGGTKVLSTEMSSNGSKKFMIGYFSTFTEALQFSKDIEKLGINDAFVSQYNDGSRNEGFDETKMSE
ncbi:MAG: hypothetical protein KA797_09265 [Chitinophagales bacterium]|nr:hypothetical protein [Chitinophagales bacterium]